MAEKNRGEKAAGVAENGLAAAQYETAVAADRSHTAMAVVVVAGPREPEPPAVVVAAAAVAEKPLVVVATAAASAAAVVASKGLCPGKAYGECS